MWPTVIGGPGWPAGMEIGVTVLRSVTANKGPPVRRHGQRARLRDADRPARLPVLAAFGGDAKLHCSTIAARLADRLPDPYADVTTAAVSSQLRAFGITVKNIREPGRSPALGCERTAIEAATR